MKTKNNKLSLYINTSLNDLIVIKVLNNGEVIVNRKIKANKDQAEKLVPAIDKLLSQNKIPLQALKKIIVANSGSSFTSLRIGVITANALGYALKIPVEAESKTGKTSKKFANYSLVEPIYSQEPNIGAPKSTVY